MSTGSENDRFDLLVVGGGVFGLGTALDDQPHLDGRA